jgi:hypothetical protein
MQPMLVCGDFARTLTTALLVMTILLGHIQISVIVTLTNITHQLFLPQATRTNAWLLGIITNILMTWEQFSLSMYPIFTTSISTTPWLPSKSSTLTAQKPISSPGPPIYLAWGVLHVQEERLKVQVVANLDKHALVAILNVNIVLRANTVHRQVAVVMPATLVIFETMLERLDVTNVH